MLDEESDRRKPSPNVPGEAGYKFGLELHIGQQFARASELRAQIIRFQRSPDVMGKAWCMCDPLCNTPWQNLCSYPIIEVFPEPQRAHHMFSRILNLRFFTKFSLMFFVEINIIFVYFDNNRKQVTRTWKKKIVRQKLVDLLIKNSWKHVMSSLPFEFLNTSSPPS